MWNRVLGCLAPMLDRNLAIEVLDWITVSAHARLVTVTHLDIKFGKIDRRFRTIELAKQLFRTIEDGVYTIGPLSVGTQARPRLCNK